MGLSLYSEPVVRRSDESMWTSEARQAFELAVIQVRTRPKKEAFVG
jgi:hypothetical protein